MAVESNGPDTVAPLRGWGQMGTSGAVSRFGAFSNSGGANAVVVERRNAVPYLAAFDNTSPLATGLPIANLSAQAANVNVILRDDTGAQIQTAVLALTAGGHEFFMLPALCAATAMSGGWPSTWFRREARSA